MSEAAAVAVSAAPDESVEDSRARLVSAKEALSGVLLERESIIWDAIAALSAGEHFVLIGEAGVAKSMLVRVLTQVVVDDDGNPLNYFEYLLTPFTEPNELFGSVDIDAFKAGVTRRHVAGMLPEANIAFLDEAFKANSAILNSLLAILNERLFHNGRDVLKTPLRSCFMASNELPQASNHALWDRCLVRHSVVALKKPENRKVLFEGSLPRAGDLPSGIFTLGDLERVRDFAIANVVIPEDTSAKFQKLCSDLSPKGISVSDRRVGQIGRYLRVCAALEGQTSVVPEMFDRLSPILWNDLADIKAVNAAIEPFAAAWKTQLRVGQASFDAVLALIPQDDAAVRSSDPTEVGKWTRSLTQIMRDIKGYSARPEVQTLLTRVRAQAQRLRDLSNRAARDAARDAVERE